MFTFICFMLVVGGVVYVVVSKAVKNPEVSVGIGRVLFGLFRK